MAPRRLGSPSADHFRQQFVERYSQRYFYKQHNGAPCYSGHWATEEATSEAQGRLQGSGHARKQVRPQPRCAGAPGQRSVWRCRSRIGRAAPANLRADHLEETSPGAPAQGRLGSSQPTHQLEQSYLEGVSASSPSIDQPRNYRQQNWHDSGQL